MNGIRAFLESCPSCDGPITLDQKEVESCCKPTKVVAATCEKCGTRIFETNELPKSIRE